MCGHKANVNVPCRPTRLDSLRLASPRLDSPQLEARLAEMFSIMLECNKLPVKATTKTTHSKWNGEKTETATVPGVELGLWLRRRRWRSSKGKGWVTCICTHINLLLLSLCQWATFEVRCRLGNKTNTNDKARAMTEGVQRDRVGGR